MKQAKVLNQSELKRLLRVTSTTKHGQRNRVVVLLSYLAGLRACEIASLKIADVMSVQTDKIEVNTEIVLRSWQTKGNKTQTVVLGTQLRNELASYLDSLSESQRNPNAPLIQSQKGSGFSSQTIQNLFRTLYSAAHVEHASSHSGRRTFITNLSEKGVSVRVIQELARHSSLVTTQRYIDVSVDKLRCAVEAVSI
jgi:integrase/recombinase XerD